MASASSPKGISFPFSSLILQRSTAFGVLVTSTSTSARIDLSAVEAAVITQVPFLMSLRLSQILAAFTNPFSSTVATVSSEDDHTIPWSADSGSTLAFS